MQLPPTGSSAKHFATLKERLQAAGGRLRWFAILIKHHQRLVQSSNSSDAWAG